MDHYQMLGDCFLAPTDKEGWLETYFGSGWKKREENWSWLFNAHNHINLEELGIC
jgi:hypothetical protein